MRRSIGTEMSESVLLLVKEGPISKHVLQAVQYRAACLHPAKQKKRVDCIVESSLMVCT